jgi:hypothetical protein
MLRILDDYDHLAKRAEKWIRARRKQIGSPWEMKSSGGVLEGSKWEMQ